MTIALARRYRPRRFADLVAQDHIAAALRGAVAKGRVGHGYLLSGPRGVGKTTAARILAMALNCERRDPVHPTGEPCGECSSCLKIWNGSADLDVVEIDAASNRGVDDARDLRERAMYAASQAGHHKVYIVDEAHMLTREAWNVLLKILEEPPPGVVFVFATTEPQKIANTAAPVLSRLQRFDFRRIGPAAIQARLATVVATEKLVAEPDALVLIARHADGGMRDALSVLDQCLSFGEGPLTAQRVRDVLGLVDDEAYGGILAAVAARQPGEIFAIMDGVADAGADLAEFAGGLAEVLRALVMHHYGAAPEGLTESTRAMIAAAAVRIATEDAVRMLKLLADAESGIRRSANPRLGLETLILRWAMMDRVVDLKELLAGRVPLAAIAPAPIPVRKPVARAEPDVQAPEPPVEPAAPSAGTGTPAGPLDTATVEAGWPEVIETASRQSRLLGQALTHATPRVEGRAVVLAFGPDSAVFQEGVSRQLGTVETILGAWAGQNVTVRLDAIPAPEPAGGAKRGRLSVDDVRRDRLGQLRRSDPALDAAAEALDLELVDEG
ncbi:MAG TPA: DNA polymerase III subunit gamma/tau [Gemmatimonadales bacterium]|nr:DNA polymerase III subunit gamma/tau [Gemmatimonadales bacterium]